MFTLISFSIGVVLLAIVVALVAFAVMIFAVPLIWKRPLSPFSYFAALVFAIILAVSNSFFIGLMETKSQLECFEHSPEFRLVQRGQELLGEYSGDLVDVIELFIGEDVSAETISYKKSQINKYLWINGILCIVVFVIGMIVVYVFAGPNVKRQKVNSYGHFSRNHMERRGREYKTRHRQI